MAKVPTVLASVIIALSTVSPAHAGFEWKGPLSPPAARTQPPAAGEMSGLEPVIMWDGSQAPALEWNKEVPMPAEKVEAVEETVIRDDATMLPKEEMAALPPAPAAVVEAEEEISGFGSDLPLVIALQQVVPPGYQFSFSKGVNPGATVSWEGGKPWKNVLADMLSTQGLGYKIRDNAVVIGYFPSETQEAVQQAPVSARAEQIPDDMLIRSAPSQEGTQEPVVIRRQKPSSLLKKEAAEEASEVVPHTRMTATAPAPADATASAGKPLTIVDMPETAPQEAAPAWSGAKGQTLRDVLKNWSDVAGVELYWSIDYDYRLQDDIGYPGTYDEAVGKLLDRFATARPQPYGQLHQSAEGPRVLVVKSYDITP